MQAGRQAAGVRHRGGRASGGRRQEDGRAELLPPALASSLPPHPAPSSPGLPLSQTLHSAPSGQASALPLMFPPRGSLAGPPHGCAVPSPGHHVGSASGLGALVAGSVASAWPWDSGAAAPAVAAFL